jgi:hypothetical protein
MSGYVVVNLGVAVVALGCAARWVCRHCKKFTVEVKGKFGND